MAVTDAPLPTASAPEAALSAAYTAQAARIRELEHAGDYAGVARHMAELRPLVDGFFDGVMVMSDDPALRAQRVGLIARVRDLFTGLADLARIQDRR